ncbi:MAG TPA: protein phosphatase 2C domain-containing protein [Gemmatimonadales bacterium]|nr:protein phosphatase 2C domain-containing protein [Gemmatimonadales bacterium]
MGLSEVLQATLAADLKPRDEDLDLFGLTHQGLVRSENQDHFLIGTLHRELAVHGTSLPMSQMVLRGERFATFGIVADGVGGRAGGAAASQRAVEAITQYVQSTLRCFNVADPDHEPSFVTALHNAALEAHKAVQALRGADDESGPATTLTMAIGIWPRAYVLQVGDSRCYVYGDGALRRLTRDQTVAQDFVDSGALKAEEVARSPYRNVLSSAIGGQNADPVVTALNQRRDNVLLLCSDGLTKHVSDIELETCLATVRSAEQACRDLLQMALARGGTDNITIIVGRARREPKGDS